MTRHSLYPTRTLAALGATLAAGTLVLMTTGAFSASAAPAPPTAEDVRLQLCAAATVEEVAALRAELDLAADLLSELPDPLPALPEIRDELACDDAPTTTMPPPTDVTTTPPTATSDPTLAPLPDDDGPVVVTPPNSSRGVGTG